MTNPPPDRQPYPPQQFQQQQFAYAPPAPLPPRPPLSSRQKRGALVAGAVGFALLTLGLDAVVLPVTIAVVLFLVLVVLGGIGAIAYSAGGQSAWDQFWSFPHTDITPYIPWAIGLVAAGIVLIVLAILASGWILKGHGVHRRTAVTWTGIGIGLAGNVIVGGIGGMMWQLIVAATPQFWDDPSAIIVATVVSGLIAIVGAAVVGAFAWWWMAHAFRARQQQA